MKAVQLFMRSSLAKYMLFGYGEWVCEIIYCRLRAALLVRNIEIAAYLAVLWGLSDFSFSSFLPLLRSVQCGMPQIF
jgi:hypothetical protein